MEKIYKTILFILFIVSINNINAQISLVASSGTSTGSYATLKAAIDNINNGTHQGDIVIKVHSNTTEIAAISLDSNGNGGIASYSSVLIRPADSATVSKVISCTLSGATLLTLQGADNITFDGRPMGVGTAQFLTFQHTVNAASSHVISYINGASNGSIKYCNIVGNASTGANSIYGIWYTTSAATNGNMYDSVQYCNVSGTRYAIYASGSVTYANSMENIFIRANNLYNNVYAGGYFGGIKSFTLDSNSVYHNYAVSSTNPMGFYLLANCDAFNATVTNNRIYDLQTIAAAGIYGIYINPTLAVPTVVPVINCYNNFISLTQSSGTCSGVFGLYFLGTTPAVCRIINNSVRIGGTHTGGTAGGVVSYGLIKTNTSTAATFVSRNNVFINNRTGGTTGIFHTGFRIQLTAMVGILDIDYNNYWATGTAGSGPFPATWGNSLYAQTGLVGYQTAAAATLSGLEVHSTFNNVNFISNTNLALTGTSINNYIVMGCPRSSLVLSDIFGTTRGNPTYRGAHESTPFNNLKDAAVQEVYSLGKLPIPYANPHSVSANIRNTGIDTIFNQKVKLTIAGTNSFIDSLYIDTIAPGLSKTVKFNSFNYVNLGISTATVTVPNDSTNSNNSKVYNQIITTSTYAYADPTIPALGGVGFNGGTGDFVAKFPYTGFNSINQIGVNIFSGGQTIKVGIWDTSSTGGPGSLLWSSPSFTTVTGANTIIVNPPVAVTGSFCVGVIQFNTTNSSFGYQNENPIRSGTFYYTAPTGGTTWTDFGSNNSAFRFMIEPRLQVADDIGLASIDQPCAAVMTGSSAIAPQFKITNYGLNSQSSYIVRSQITGPVNSTTADTLSLFLASGESATINAATLFNPTTPGTYTIKAWTQLTGDLERNNDTITYSFTVVTPSIVNTSSNGLQFSGTQYLQTNGAKTLNITTEKLTLEAWVNKTSNSNDNYIVSKDSTTSISQYSFYISAAGYLVFKLNTTIAVDSVIANVIFPTGVFTHAAATYDGVNMNIYQNGNLVGSKAMFGTIVGNKQPVFIGRSLITSTGFLVGSIDEIRIWDTCRTALQIRRNMHTRLPNSSNVNLKAYYRLDEISGSYVVDASGNCNAGIINNTPTFLATNFPLGTPNVNNQTISSSGTQAFAGTGINMNIYNQSASNDIYVHRFTDSALVVSPITAPGGVTAVFQNYWLMYRYGAGTMDSANVTFNVVGIVTGANANDFKLFTRANGSSATWTLAKNNANAFSLLGQTVTMGLDSTLFNNQFMIGAINNPLPVQLISFTGNAKNDNANLYWSTASEINNNGFAIERSFDGRNFTEIGFVNGAVNSNQLTNYNFVDANVFLVNKAVFYRLKQVELNGEFEYSKTISIVNGKDILPQVIVYPNPITDHLYVAIESFENANTQLNITDITGKIIKDVTIHLNAGYNKFAIENLNELTNGIYMVNIVSNGTVIYNNKFVKVK